MTRIFVTGPPRSGKSTLISRIVVLLKNKGIETDGFFTPEIRGATGRKGFYIIDARTGERKLLAYKEASCSYIKYGSYCLRREAGVFIKNIIERALNSSCILVVDEIGPMELALPEAYSWLKRALQLHRDIIGVIYWKLKSRNPEIYRLLENSIIYDLSSMNPQKAERDIIGRLRLKNP